MTSSFDEKSRVSVLKVAPPNYHHPYPPPMAIYENIVESPQVFMVTLKMLHAGMRTEFKIPVIGGKELNLHRLFIEVTTRGGIKKVVEEQIWKEVKLVFDFHSSITHASFLLQKYYNSLLFHYERVYYFKEMYWSPSPCDLVELSSVSKIETTFSEAPSTISGFINGKFDSRYLVTVKIGSEDFKGVLYHQIPVNQVLQNQKLPTKKAVSTNVVKREKKETLKEDEADY